MAISGDYARPVTVNGFACRNCAEVAQATRHIDPAHPKDGPYGVNAPDKSARPHGPAVTLSGRLADLSQTAPAVQPATVTAAQGLRLDISV